MSEQIPKPPPAVIRWLVRLAASLFSRKVERAAEKAIEIADGK